MTDGRNTAIARALINLYFALAEIDQDGDPNVAKAEGRKYVALAIHELIALSPAFDGDMLENLIPHEGSYGTDHHRRPLITQAAGE